MSYANIRSALEAHVSTITNVPSYLAWQNVRFEPTTGASWLRLNFTPTRRRPSDVTASGQKRYDGLFLIDVFVPEGSGPSAGDTLAGNIISAFEAGTVLTANSQPVEIEYAEISNTVNQDGPWFMIPITIKWKAFN